MCCVRNPRNINVFVRVPGREESGSRPGGSVTGVTAKLFMCQMFMCLFRPLNFGPEFLGQIFWFGFFPAKEAPYKSRLREIHLPKLTFQNSAQKSGKKNHSAPLQGHSQTESNMHRFEGHHFASRFAPHFLVGEHSGFMLEILFCLLDGLPGEIGGFPVPENGNRSGKRGGKGDTKR